MAMFSARNAEDLRRSAPAISLIVVAIAELHSQQPHLMTKRKGTAETS